MKILLRENAGPIGPYITRLFTGSDFELTTDKTADVDRILYLASGSTDDVHEFMNIGIENNKKNKDFKFIYVSSYLTYGAIAGNTLPDEESLLRPNTTLSAIMASSEMFVSAKYRSDGLPVVLLVMSDCYGPDMKGGFTRHVIDKIKKGEGVEIESDDEHDRLFVSDAVEALELILRYGKAGKKYNISSNSSCSDRVFATLIYKEMKEIDKDLSGLILNTGDKEASKYGCSSDLFRKMFLWKSRVDFKEGIRYTIQKEMN